MHSDDALWSLADRSNLLDGQSRSVCGNDTMFWDDGLQLKVKECLFCGQTTIPVEQSCVSNPNLRKRPRSRHHICVKDRS